MVLLLEDSVQVWHHKLILESIQDQCTSSKLNFDATWKLVEIFNSFEVVPKTFKGAYVRQKEVPNWKHNQVELALGYQKNLSDNLVAIQRAHSDELAALKAS